MIRARIFNGLLGLTAVLITVSIGLSIWAKYIEPPWLKIRNLPFPAAATVSAGEAIELAVERCNSSKKTQTYTITRSLRNEVTGISELLPEVILSIEPGCHRTLSKVNIIPKSQPPGIYSAWGIAIIQMRIGKQEIDWYTDKFEVLPPKPAEIIKVIPGPPGKQGPQGIRGVPGETGPKGTFWGSK
jgi:hypothetical protein